jgi:anti-sigma factor RsiW
MTTDHLSRETLEAFARQELPADTLGSVDRHVAGCEACRSIVASIVTVGPGLLAAVRFERERHLSFHELESVVEGSSSTDVLAQEHLAHCESCQRELADLRSFEPLLQRGTALGRTAAAPPVASVTDRLPRRWFSSPLAWATAAAAILVLLAVGPRLTQLADDSTVAPAAFVVRLDAAEGVPEPGNGSSTLRGGAVVPLPTAVVQALGRARREAARTGEAQTIEVSVTRLEYDALAGELRSIGTLEDVPDPGVLAVNPETDDQIVLSVTLLPAGTP